MVKLESSKSCMINLQPYIFPHFQIEHGIWDVGQFLRRAGRGKPALGEKSPQKREENQQLTQLPSAPGQYIPGGAGVGNSAYENGGDARRLV